MFKKLKGGKPALELATLAFLRGLPIGASFPLAGSAEVEVLVHAIDDTGYVFSGTEGKAVITKRGLKAAYPWAIETSYRQDRGIWEGICAHGVGHPIGPMPRKVDGIHGCDMCCAQKGSHGPERLGA